MKFIFTSVLIFAFSVSFGQTKTQVNAVLDQMKASGTISAEQIEATRKELTAMDDKEYNKVVNKAHIQARNPAFQEKIKDLFKGQERP